MIAERGGRGQAARNAPQSDLAAADPRAFIPGLAMSPAPRVPPDRANPDPLAFGTVVAGPKQQLNALLLQLPSMKEDPEQEFGLQFLLREIKKVQSSAAKQGISLPVEADTAARELTATLVSFAAGILSQSQYICRPACLVCFKQNIDVSPLFLFLEIIPVICSSCPDCSCVSAWCFLLLNS